MLTETNGAGAPFPHCFAAHGASGGPRAPPEDLLPVTSRAIGRKRREASERLPPLELLKLVAAGC